MRLFGFEISKVHRTPDDDVVLFTQHCIGPRRIGSIPAQELRNELACIVRCLRQGGAVHYNDHTARIHLRSHDFVLASKIPDDYLD